jgi:hypothetical protein
LYETAKVFGEDRRTVVSIALGQVSHENFGKFRISGALRKGEEGRSASALPLQSLLPFGLKEGLDAWGGGAQHDGASVKPSEFQRDALGMVARGGFLLVSLLVLLIHHYQPNV